MKKSFMTRVLAVSLSAAMAFSMSSASNLMTASAASTVNLHTTFKTLKVNQTYKMVLKNNTLNWKITKVTTTNKKICTVYGKTASSVMLKGKGVGRAKITVKVKTTKRKYPKNIKNMKCTVNVKAADTETPDVAFSATAAANSNTEVRVNFTKAVDAAAVENFKITEANVSVSKAELSEDKKSVVLTVAGAEYNKNYELTVTGIKVGGTVQADQKLTFTTPSPQATHSMTLTADDPILKSDGQSTTTLTFKITDAQGNPLTDKGMEVRFTTNLGKFATDRVSIQNGEAKVMYTSEALNQNHTAMITATIIEAPADTKLIGQSANTSISLMPNPDQLDDTSIGATLTSITAPTADCIYAYFNKEVNAEDFKVGDKPNTKKFAAEIKSGLDNGYGEGLTMTEHTIVGILPVENDKTALQLLVDKPMVDNSIVKVEFENKTQTNGIYIPKNTAYCKLTDARQPAVVSINPIDQRTIEIEFSEAVLRKADCEKDNDREIALAAENLNNYQIDGVQLSNQSYWGEIENKTEKEDPAAAADSSSSLKLLSKKIGGDDNSDEKGSITVGKYGKRNVVTIKLSRSRYLQSGRTHRISIANVGDWAAKTDKERNIVSTEGFDFDVAEDTTTPSFTATAMSPEQYLLEFTSDIVTVSKSDNIKTKNSFTDHPSVIKLEAKNANGTWSEISDAATGSGKNPIQVTRVEEDGKLTNKYLVEVIRDWTEVYNTSSTRDNYYRHEYRLTIAADKIQNPVNGNKNAALSVELTDDIMRSADGKSPEIDKIEDAEGNIGSYNVFMTEPVKLSSTANSEGLTPSQTQQNGSSTNMGVPAPEAQFVHVGDGRTVEGIIESNIFVDAYDQIINVEPATDLGNGEWDLIVRSISDDIGNTAPTLTERITIDNPVTETDFKVVWAAVGYDPGAYAFNSADSKDYGEAVKEAIDKGEGNCIYVKFNKPVTLIGSSTNAQSLSNYTLNGSQLPTGTEIRAHIKGYDYAVGTSTGIVDSVTIVLPKDRFGGNNNGTAGIYTVSAFNTMLNISKTITCSTTNEILDNGGMVRIPFQFGTGVEGDAKVTTTGNTNVVPYIKSLNAKTDAVWGNDASEKYGAEGLKTREEYFTKVKEVLEDEKYRKVVLDSSIGAIDLTDTDKAEIKNVFGRSGTLAIKRVVDLDLNGVDIKGNITVTTNSLADEMFIYSSATKPSTITGKNEKEATLTVNAGKVDHFWIRNVEVKPGQNELGDKFSDAILLNDVWVNSFKVDGNCLVRGNINITDSDGFGLDLDDAGTVAGDINVNGAGVANFEGDFTGKNIYLNQASEVRLGSAKLDAGTKITVSSNATKIFLDGANIITNPTIIAAAKEVQVYLGTIKPGQINFKANTGCGFVSIDKDGNKTSSNDLKDVVEDSKVAAALKTVAILPAGTPVSPESKDDNVVITMGAITSGGSLDLKKAEACGHVVEDDYGVARAIKVEFNASNLKLVDLSNGVLKEKDKWKEEDAKTEDVITVVLTCGDQIEKRKITIKKG